VVGVVDPLQGGELIIGDGELGVCRAISSDRPSKVPCRPLEGPRSTSPPKMSAQSGVPTSSFGRSGRRRP
jgi:hypothetical protein